MSQGHYPKDDASSKRGSSLLRHGSSVQGSSASRVPPTQNGKDAPTENFGMVGNSSPNAPMVPNDQTVISSTPPMSSVNVTATEPQGPFQVGDRLGVYELTEYVGGGGMGSVYKAFDTLLQRVVAIKILLPDAANNEEAVLRFQNEARSAARLDHDNIAKIHYVGEEDGLPYLVFEFVDGINIRDLVRQQGPLSLSDAIGVALQVADSLTHANENGVMHRDVKPSNILLRGDGQIKLIDFGLARIVEVEERDNDLTASGVTLGTFDYISPEQARDPRTVDVRSDIYSLGCTLFYMLTGRPPFPEGTVLQKLLQHQGDRPPHLLELRPDLPEEIALLLDRMLAKDPNDRFQTPLELREQIHLLAVQLDLDAIHYGAKNWAIPVARKPSFLSRHMPWLLPVTTLLLIVIGLDYYLTQKPQAPVDASFPALNGTLPADPPSTAVTTTPFASREQEQDADRKTTSPLSVTEDRLTTTTFPSAPEPIRLSQDLHDSNFDAENAIGASDANDSLKYLKVGPSTLWNETRNGYSTPGLEMPATYGLSGITGTPRFATDSIDLEQPGSQPQSEHATINNIAPLPGRSVKSVLGTNTRSGIITVGESQEESVTYASLASACRAAATGAIIELRYNGKRVEQPFALAGKNLIIRAAEGYNPTVVFRPTKSEATDPDPILTPNSMITLDGGSLTAIKVSFHLELDDVSPMDHWTLFEVQSGETVQLEKNRLSIRNQSQQTASFFRVSSSPSDELANERGSSLIKVGPISPAKIVLTDSIVRGNATFLLVNDQRPVNCSWKNGLLVTDGLMLDVRGSETTWNHTDHINISLKHLTAFAASGMCRLGDSHQGPLSIPVDYTCFDSIILVADTNAMITQWIAETSSDTESLFHFTGDRNYYQGFDYLLIQKTLNSKTDLNQLDFTAWQNRWSPDYETYSLWGWFAFVETPDASKSLDQRGPADYALSTNPENPIRYAADDGSNLGFLLEHLPEATSSQK